MAFLGNSAVNRINLHYGIYALATASGGTFLLVFLLRVGLTAPEALLTSVAFVAGRFAVRPFVLPLAKRFGLKAMVIFGTFMLALQYPLSAGVSGLDWALFARNAVAAIGEAFYWTCFHAYFASLGDSEHRGHQIGAREALAQGIAIVAPLLGAWALESFGPQWMFPAVGIVQALAILPLLGLPDVAVKREAPGAFRGARAGALIFVVHGWFTAGFIVVWQVGLFVALGTSFSAYGGAMALAALAGAAGGLLLGKRLDGGHGAYAVLFVFGGMIAATVVRAASLGSPEAAVAANAFGVFAMCFYVPTLMTAVYNLSKVSPCSLRFHMAAEGAWDIGYCAAVLLCVAFLAGGLAIGTGVLLAVPALAALGVMLRRYFVRALPV
jgi:MFS family permease